MTKALLNNMIVGVHEEGTEGKELTLELADGSLLEIKGYTFIPATEHPRDQAVVLFTYDHQKLEEEGHDFKGELGWLHDSGINPQATRIWRSKEED